MSKRKGRGALFATAYEPMAVSRAQREAVLARCRAFEDAGLSYHLGLLEPETLARAAALGIAIGGGESSSSWSTVNRSSVGPVGRGGSGI